MKRKRTIVAILALIFLTGICYQLMVPTSLDFTEDEAPFCNIKMPPKHVKGMIYYGVEIVIVDQDDREHCISFPGDETKISDIYPTAYEGLVSAPQPHTHSLKDPERARRICIQLLKDYGRAYTGPFRANVLNWNHRSLKALSKSPDFMTERIASKIESLFR